PAVGITPTTASFLDAADFYADHTGTFPIGAETASSTATTTAIVTALSTLAVPSTALVDGTLAVGVALNRTTAPAGPIASQPVVFTLTAPGGGTTALTGMTDLNG